MPNTELSWVVIEQSVFANAYAEFSDESGLIWVNAEEENHEKWDVVLLSCTLQYLENPIKIVKKWAKCCNYMVIMRVPFIDEDKNVATKQVLENGIYPDGSSWPAWFFSRNLFLHMIEEVGEIVYQWVTPSEKLLFEGSDVVMEGMLVKCNTKSGV